MLGSLNTDWATEELEKFLRLTELYRPPNPPGMMDMSSQMSNRGAASNIIASAQVVEQILDRVLPGWKATVPDDRNSRVNRWCQHREAAERALAAIARDGEVRRKPRGRCSASCGASAPMGVGRRSVPVSFQ